VRFRERERETEREAERERERKSRREREEILKLNMDKQVRERIISANSSLLLVSFNFKHFKVGFSSNKSKYITHSILQTSVGSATLESAELAFPNSEVISVPITHHQQPNLDPILPNTNSANNLNSQNIHLGSQVNQQKSPAETSNLHTTHSHKINSSVKSTANTFGLSIAGPSVVGTAALNALGEGNAFSSTMAVPEATISMSKSQTNFITNGSLLNQPAYSLQNNNLGEHADYVDDTDLGQSVMEPHQKYNRSRSANDVQKEEVINNSTHISLKPANNLKQSGNKETAFQV
jgi:hypothetical protein